MKKFINYLDNFAITVGQIATAKPKLSIITGVLGITALVLSLSHSQQASELITETKLPLPKANNIKLAALEPPSANMVFSDEAETIIEEEDSNEIVTVKSGDSLAVIFKRLGIGAAELQKILALGKIASPLKRMQPGKQIYFTFGDDHQLAELTYPINITTQLKIIKEDGKYKAQQQQRQLETRLTYADATIQNSLYQAARRADLSDKQIMQLSKIFAWDIDFARSIRSGDQFKVLYEEHYLDGKKVRSGNIVAATFNHRGKDYNAVYFEDSNGNSGFYTPDGRNLQKQFMRAPLKYQRISSPFTNKRLHPIHKVYRKHTGTDYAAATGTPIKAASDGVITYIGRKGGYGKMITIKHNDKYSTLYGHMNGYAKNMKLGSKVKHDQIIGYVGATGFATGPHLHYEILVNGVPHNAQTVELPNGAPISSSYKQEFLAYAAKRMQQLKTYEETLVAESNANVSTS